MRTLPLIALSALLLSSPASAQEATAWQSEKCALYTDAWNRALDGIAADDINYNFLASNENFIASGCTETIAICPQSDREMQIAEMLTVMMMNQGAASTFLPFRCADEPTSMTEPEPEQPDVQ